MKRNFLAALVFLSIKCSIAQNTYPFPSSGNVGIGTTTPTHALEVIGPLKATTYGVFGNVVVGDRQAAYVTSQGIVGDGPNAALKFYGTNQGWASSMFEFDCVYPDALKAIYSPANGAAIVKISSGWGSANTTGLNGSTLAIEPVINFQETGTSTTLRGVYYNPTITSFDGIHIAFQNTLGNNIFNSSSGNTIIGTATDDGANKLQVTGNIKATGLIIPTNAAVGKILTSDANGNATWQTSSGGSGEGSWMLNGNNILNANIGFVGIGTSLSFINTDDNLKLAVNGNIRAKKLTITQGNWADYVFLQNYDLLPLHKLEKYIRENNHLPEIPSAAEVEKNGIDVGDNQALLLKKVEELTLYLIDQNKKIEEQQKQIEELKKLIGVKRGS